MSAMGIVLENRVQSDRRLPPAMKEALGRNVGFVDAGDLVHFGLADAIPVQDWIKEKVLPRKHVAACTESKVATHGNIGEDKAAALRLPVQPLDHADPPALRVEDGCATDLAILDEDIR
jgi:hypothetical protein